MSDSWTVELTYAELLVAGLIGNCCNTQALKQGWKETTGQPDEQKFGHNAEGIGGQTAFCKRLNIYHHPNVGDFTAPDAGPYQVRTNCSRKWDDMVLRPDTRDELKANYIWIAVRAFTPKFFIHGWAWGDEVMQDKATCEWFRVGARDRAKAWWMPSGKLHSMDELPSIRQTLELMKQRNELVPA